MADIFGYNRTIQEDSIVSSDFAKITVGTNMGLIQQFNATYQRRIEPRFEVGSSDLYWVHGQPQGQIQVQKLVGTDGILGGINLTRCGKINSISINIKPGSACAPGGSGGISFDGAMIQSVNFTAQASNLDISTGLTILCAEMKKN